MIKRLRSIGHDSRGAAVIEMAFTLPALIIMMWMIVQLGLVYRAMSGIQHGLGQGARSAVLFSSKSMADRKADVKTQIQAAVYGIGPGSFVITDPTEGTADGATYLDLKVTYTQATNLLLLPGPTINVSRSKRVWIAAS